MFFIFSGLGLGNTTRILSIVEEIITKNYPLKIILFTWGKPVSILKNELLFKPYVEIHELKPYQSKKVLYPIVFIQNCVKLLKERIAQNPALVVLDSDYHFPAFFFRNFKIVYLSQCLDVLDRAKKYNYKPSSLKIKLRFFFTEVLDYTVQKFFSDIILVPSFEGSGNFGKFQKIPLVVRKSFTVPLFNPTIQAEYFAVGSGSNIDKEKFEELILKVNAQKIPEGRLTVSDSFLNSSFILCRGGLSTISEAIATQKPCICLPISNHPEQEINALTVEKLGLGINLRGSDTFTEKLSIYKSNVDLANFTLSKISTLGSASAAKKIFDLIE